MKRWKKYAAGLLLTTGLSSQVRAQVPVVAAAPAAAPAVVAAPAAAPANIWTFLCLSPEQKAACKDKLCNSVLGQMLNNGLKPISAFSGGLIPSCCPPVSAADLAMPADTAQGAAARAKADEADAKARREAVRFLGTVDCHYWPEAQEALINSLRGDRNECVRLEAAFALNRGCCCSKIIIKALVMCVSGRDDDGFPGERSERVRATAQVALEHCLACYTEVVPVPEVKKKDDKEIVPVPRGEAKPANGPDKLPAKLNQPMTPVEYYKRTQLETREEIIAESKQVLAHLQPVAAQTQAMTAPQEGSSGGMLEIIQHAFGGPSSTTTAVVREVPLSPPLATATTQPAPTSHEMPAAPTHESMPVAARPMPSSPMMATPSTPAKPTVAERSVAFQTVVDTPPTPVKPTVPEKAVPLPPVVPAPVKPTVAEKPVPLPPVVPAPPAPIAAQAMNYTSSFQQVKATEKVTPTIPAPVPTTKLTPVPAPTPVTPAPANDGMNMTLAQVLATLRDSPHPEYRSWAADNLATVDSLTSPDVVQALANAARMDHVASVRATCVHALGRMRCSTMVAVSAMQSAKNDPDPHVRQEAALSLQLVSGGQGASLTVPPGR